MKPYEEVRVEMDDSRVDCKSEPSILLGPRMFCDSPRAFRNSQENFVKEE